jgi:outer membrane protein OmpA-like peptidoglycan-associated protein
MINEDCMHHDSSNRSRITLTTHPRASRAAVLLTAVALSACAVLNKKEEGALIGAGVGGAAGAIIGHQMDQQAKELKQNIAGATVERVGEGIQVTFASGLLYDIDSDRVRAEAAENLRNLAASLGKYPKTDLLIVGHTDSTGTNAYNQSLSERRAQSASAFLLGQGVSAGRLRTAGRGEGEPITTNGTDAGRQLNRRVEVAIYANSAARTAGDK